MDNLFFERDHTKSKTLNQERMDNARKYNQERVTESKKFNQERIDK